MISDSSDSGQFIRLAPFASAAEAGMVAELLGNNGIRVVLQGANFGGLEPLRLPGGFSETWVLVPEAQLDQALDLYQAFFVRNDESGDDE